MTSCSFVLFVTAISCGGETDISPIGQGQAGMQSSGTASSQGGAGTNVSIGGQTSSTSNRAGAPVSVQLCVPLGHDSRSCITQGTTAGQNLGAGTIQPECKLPADSGSCSNYTTRYAFDQSTWSCKPFEYGGCGGNENNFLTSAQCQLYCASGIFCACPQGATNCSVSYGCAACPERPNYATGLYCDYPGLYCQQGEVSCLCIASDAGSSAWTCYAPL